MVSQLTRLLAGIMVVFVMTTMETGCAAHRGGHVLIKQDPSNASQWRMSNGVVDLMVDSAKGRVMFYGYKNERNILWTNAQFDVPAFRIGSWVNPGGDKVWPWPQEYWGWPPPEPAGYDVQLSDDGRSLQMTSAPIAGYDIRVIRLIEMAPKGTEVTFTTYFKSTGNTFGKPLAAWSITQVPHPERMLVRIPLGGDRRAYLDRAPEKSDQFIASAAGESAVELRWPADRGIKTFMEADAFAVVYQDVVFLQHQLPATGSDPWTPNQRAQIYCHPNNATNIPPGPSYTELEWTAPLAPRSRLDLNPLRLTWSLAKAQNAGDAEVVRMLEAVK